MSDTKRRTPPKPGRPPDADPVVYLPNPSAIISGRKFWKRRAIREYVAAIAHEPSPPALPDDSFLIGSLEVRQMLGNVSDMWIWRHSRRAAAPQSAA